MKEYKEIIFKSINKLGEWIQRNGWKAYDPFDGLNAKALSFLTFNNHYLKILLQQSIRRMPFNLRPILGIQKATSSKGMGFCASGFLKLFRATGEKKYLESTKYCLDWLKNNYCRGYTGYSWGNHFNYESRGGSIPLNVPTIVWTSLIGNAFMDAYEELEISEYLNVANSACEFIVNDIGRYEEPDGSLCLMYTPQNKDTPSLEGCIHNSNILGASLLGRAYKYSGEEKLFNLAKKAIGFTVKYQLSEGGWYYGVERRYWWIDSFHTGYVLESLFRYMIATGDRSYEENLIRGYKYFISKFFKEDGIPGYYAQKTRPIDIQCASQGIQTLVNLKNLDFSSIEVAKKVALWTIKNMQNTDGYFYFRKYPILTNKTPMFHWGQATMLAALATLFVEILNE